jgi:hypothetical protein
VFTSKIPFSQDSAIISPQLNASITASNRLIVDPQALAGPSSTATARNIPTTASFNKVSVIRLNWANYTGLTTFNCNEIILPQVTDPNVAAGQIITLVVDAAVTAAVPGVELKLSTTNLDLAYTAVKFNSVAAASFTTPVLAQANDPRIRQAAITLYADNNGWRILSSVGTTVVIS